MLIKWNQYGLQDALSPVIEEFIFFHDFVITILIFILTLVGYIITSMCFNKFTNQGLLEGQFLECIWTLVPALILIQIALPSLILLYTLDDTTSSSLTLKVIGHQWYWSYEYRDFKDITIEMDCYILPEREVISIGGFRLLETDNRPVLPFMTQIRAIVRRADVLHSWAVPALGVKADANPGRLNQIKFIRFRPGLAYGQCSEICGANHRFIPICLEFIRAEDFLNWVVTTREN